MESNKAWKIGAGLAVGFAAVATGMLLSRSGRKLVREAWQGRQRTRLEDRVLDRLWADRTLARRNIDVAEVGPGVVELIGFVRSDEEADRARHIAETIDGVRTVVNRLNAEDLDAHLDGNRRRYGAGDPALTEKHWYGMEVGIGKRRQSPDTDPDRRDDKIRMVSRDLDVDRASRFTSEDPVEAEIGGTDGGAPER